jgi:WD40 repeat protein
MLYRTNLLALTGHHSTASHSQYPPNKVLIYDDHSQRTIGELSFRQKVLATKLRRDRIVVVLRDRVYVYNFSDLSLLDKVHTGDNPGGLIGLSLDNWGVGGGSGGGNSERGGGGERAIDVLGVNNVGARNGMVLACPSTQRGQVRVELYGLRRTTFIDAHESALGALALSVDGSLLATASERGTVIRLYDTRGVTVGGGRVSSVVSASVGTGSTTAVSSSVPLREFRRGVERATISCLTFSLDSCWLGCASDHGTVHIFQAQNNPNSTNEFSSTNSNKPKPRSSSMTGKAMLMLPKLVSSPKKFLMDGEHSYAQVRGVPHPHACAFVPDRECTIAVAGTDDYDNGVLLLAEFGHREVTTCTAPGNGRGGSSGGAVEDTEAKRLGYHRFFKKGGAASMHGGRNRRSSNRSKDGKLFNADIVEGGAYVDDTLSVNLRMNHIRIGDENEDDFVPIDYDMKKY